MTLSRRYTQEELDDAVAAERLRCMAICRAVVSANESVVAVAVAMAIAARIQNGD